MPVPKKTLEAAHTIISVTLLPTGRLIMATEKRMYELVNSIWTPMEFAPETDAAPDPAPATLLQATEPEAPETTTETHS
jgi:hypothetical protein